MSIQKVPSKVGALAPANKMRLSDYELIAEAVNSKGCKQTFPLPSPGISTGFDIQHDFGATFDLNVTQYHLLAYFEDAEGWPVTGIKIQKTTSNLATVIFSDAINTPFTGKVTLELVPNL
ncbi:hypothetical protein [Spirosoma areae]